ncbi:FAD binding domain-containing protein [Schnuerera ultunensis]|uniref:FAD-binding PCMH-type domain-containing protein n=1 Tax=[Clostridium] ultunense Esp TaxID=1288971 RepID=A0A1M4PLP7_9FIRM|nr:FAD binding domain-containing protein [Schnuerera ultunensis]SHD76379.1 conserved protein of unknown function [[Clostridium] ultunense Esp]
MQMMKIETPNNLDELINCLKNADSSSCLLGGGTDLIININNKKLYPNTIIDLSGVNELKEIKKNGSSISIGAGVTLTEVCENSFVKEKFPALAQATSQVGSTQIRNRATIAGNIGNSSPCADTVVPLMALNAKLKMLNGNGEYYHIPVDKAIKGSGKKNLKPNEAIIEIVIPYLKDTCSSAFYKIGSRKAVTISKLNGAVVVDINLNNTIVNAKVFLGSLGPKAFRSIMAEKVLMNKKPNKELLSEFQNILMKQVDEAIPGRGSQLYKRHAIKGMCEELFIRLFGESCIRGEI